MIYLDKSYGRLVGGVPYEVQEEGRDYFIVNNHHVPKMLCKEYQPRVDVEAEYEDFI